MYMPTGSEKSFVLVIRKSLTILLSMNNYFTAMTFIFVLMNYALKLFESYTIKSKQGLRRVTFHFKLHVYNWNIIMNSAKKCVRDQKLNWLTTLVKKLLKLKIKCAGNKTFICFG